MTETTETVVKQKVKHNIYNNIITVTLNMIIVFHLFHLYQVEHVSSYLRGCAADQQLFFPARGKTGETTETTETELGIHLKQQDFFCFTLLKQN